MAEIVDRAALGGVIPERQEPARQVPSGIVDRAAPGGAQALTQRQDEVRRLTPPAQPFRPPNLKERVGHGANQVWAGLRQLAMSVGGPDPGGQYQDVRQLEQSENASEALYQQGRRQQMPGQLPPGAPTFDAQSQLSEASRLGVAVPQDPGIDWASIGGQAGMLSPLGLVRAGTTGLRSFLKFGGAGAAEGIASYTPEGVATPQKAAQVGLGFLAGGASPFVIKGLGNVAGNAWDKATDISSAVRAQLSGKTTLAGVAKALQDYKSGFDQLPKKVKTEILREAQKQLRATGELNADALARRSFLASAGFYDDAAPTRGQLLRDAPEWGFERNIAQQEGGAEVAARFRAQQKRFEEMSTAVGNQIGGKQASPYAVGSSIIDTLKTKSDEMQQSVGALYKEARETYGDEFVAAPQKLLTVLDDLSDDAGMDTLTASIKRKLARFGVLDESGALRETENTLGAISLNKAEELRKFIGRLNASGATPAEVRRARAMLTRALDDDVEGAVNSVGDVAGQDFFAAGRKAARERFAEFEPLEKLLDDGAKPEDVAKRFIEGGSVDQLASLKKALTSGTPDQRARGTTAWNNIRRSLWNDVMNRARDKNGEITASRLSKSLAKFEPEEIEMLFGDVKGAIDTMQRAADILTDEPPYSPVNYSKTAPAMVQMMTRLLPENARELVQSVGQEERLARALSGATEPLPRPPMADAINRRTGLLRPVVPAAAIGLSQQLRAEPEQ